MRPPARARLEDLVLLDDIRRWWLGRRRCHSAATLADLPCTGDLDASAEALKRRQAELARRLAVIEAGGRLVRAAEGAGDGGTP